MMFFAVVLGLLGVIVGGIYLHAKIQGEAKIVVHVENRSAFKLEQISENKLVVSTEFEIANESEKPDATIIDAFARHLLPQEQFDRASVSTRLERSDYRRADNYMEAFPIFGQSKESLVLTLTLESVEPIEAVIQEIFDIKIEVYANYVSKEEFKIARWYFWTTKQELQTAMERGVANE